MVGGQITAEETKTGGASATGATAEPFGMAAVVKAFNGTRLPVRKADLVKKAGDAAIACTKTSGKYDLAELISASSASEFNSIAMVISAISAAVKAK